MKGKKILSILLAESMVCMCAACSSTGTDTAGKSTETGESVETGESNADEGSDKTGGDVETLSMLTYIH